MLDEVFEKLNFCQNQAWSVFLHKFNMKMFSKVFERIFNAKVICIRYWVGEIFTFFNL